MWVMIDQQLLDKLRAMELEDIFDTLNPFWEEALNWKVMTDEEFGGKDYVRSKALGWRYLPCPDCGGRTEVTAVCTASPFYERGYRSMVMCISEECTYYEYREKTMDELYDETVKEA